VASFRALLPFLNKINIYFIITWGAIVLCTLQPKFCFATNKYVLPTAPKHVLISMPSPMNHQNNDSDLLLSLPILTLDVTFEEQMTGTLYIAVYQSESTYADPTKACMKQTVEVKNQSQIQVSINQLAAGTYSIAVFLDENGNKKLDTNWMGIPTEGYGYSQGARPKYRAATWAETKFSFTAAHTEQIEVKKWRF
jgi:uncharacterized protein (DUF2141 family)